MEQCFAYFGLFMGFAVNNETFRKTAALSQSVLGFSFGSLDLIVSVTCDYLAAYTGYFVCYSPFSLQKVSGHQEPCRNSGTASLPEGSVSKVFCNGLGATRLAALNVTDWSIVLMFSTTFSSCKPDISLTLLCDCLSESSKPWWKCTKMTWFTLRDI